MERKRKSLKVVIIVAFVILLAGFAVFMQLRHYHDNNSWAEIKVFEGEVDTSITPIPQQEYYLKGDRLPIAFTEVLVEAVEYPDTVIIASDADIIYNGMTWHRVILTSGDQCEIRKGDDSVTVVVYGCGFQ